MISGKLEHPWNALLLITVTDSEIITLVSDVQSWNAPISIDFTDVGIEIIVKELK